MLDTSALSPGFLVIYEQPAPDKQTNTKNYYLHNRHSWSKTDTGFEASFDTFTSNQIEARRG
jgi:hypothetical protein